MTTDDRRFSKPQIILTLLAIGGFIAVTETVASNWGFVGIAAVFTLYRVADRLVRKRQPGYTRLGDLALVVAFWSFVPLAFIGDSDNIIWGFLACALALSLASMSRIRAFGFREIWDWRSPDAPVGVKRVHLAGEALWVAGMGLIVADIAISVDHLFLIGLLLVFIGMLVETRVQAFRRHGKWVRSWPPPDAPKESKRLYLYGDACLISGIASIVAGLASPISGFLLFALVLFGTGAYLRYRARRIWKTAERQEHGHPTSPPT